MLAQRSQSVARRMFFCIVVACKELFTQNPYVSGSFDAEFHSDARLPEHCDLDLVTDDQRLADVSREDEHHRFSRLSLCMLSRLNLRCSAVLATSHGATPTRRRSMLPVEHREQSPDAEPDGNRCEPAQYHADCNRGDDCKD